MLHWFILPFIHSSDENRSNLSSGIINPESNTLPFPFSPDMLCLYPQENLLEREKQIISYYINNEAFKEEEQVKNFFEKNYTSVEAKYKISVFLSKQNRSILIEEAKACDDLLKQFPNDLYLKTNMVFILYYLSILDAVENTSRNIDLNDALKVFRNACELYSKNSTDSLKIQTLSSDELLFYYDYEILGGSTQFKDNRSGIFNHNLPTQTSTVNTEFKHIIKEENFDEIIVLNCEYTFLGISTVEIIPPINFKKLKQKFLVKFNQKFEYEYKSNISEFWDLIYDRDLSFELLNERRLNLYVSFDPGNPSFKFGLNFEKECIRLHIRQYVFHEYYNPTSQEDKGLTSQEDENIDMNTAFFLRKRR